MEKYLSLKHRSVFASILLLFSVILSFFFLKSIFNIILLIYLAIIIAEGLRPFIDDLQKWGLTQGIAILVTYCLVLGTLFTLTWLLITPLIEQTQSLINKIPDYNEKVQSFLSGDNIFTENQVFLALKDQLGQISNNIASSLIGIPKQIFNFFFNTIMVFFLSYFWLTGNRRFEVFFSKFLSAQDQKLGHEVIEEVGANLGSYVRGVMLMMFFVGVVSGLVVWLLGLPFALLLGIIAGLTEAIPIIGPFIGAVPAVVIALFISPGTALIVGVFYLIMQQIEGNILVPAIMNRILKLEPLVILISVLIGTSLLGVVGAFLAVPTASIVHTLLNKVIIPKIQRGI